MKNKFTKGPWLIGRALPKEKGTQWESIQQRVQQVTTEDNFRVADIYDTAFDDMNLANAQLIACAPELLGMLEEVLAEFSDDKELDWEDVQITIMRVQNAVKKARGET